MRGSWTGEEVPMADEKLEMESLERLARIEGQIKGIEGMIRDRRYCVDVITQIAAAEAALHKVSELILKNHLETCVTIAFRSSDEKERRAKVDELMEVYGRLRIK